MTPLQNIIAETLKDDLRSPEDAADVAASLCEIIRLYFSEPNLVHINMLHGALAKPTLVQVMHLYPEFARAIEVLRGIETWQQAYPLAVFPEPDMKRVATVLKAAGLTLDAVSASNMRHVLDQIGKDVSAALDKIDE